jgi:hypothetical protein
MGIDVHDIAAFAVQYLVMGVFMELLLVRVADQVRPPGRYNRTR